MSKLTRSTVLFLFAFVFELLKADVYMHAPRGSNNRNCRNDNNENRRNGNRLFDSQNNAKGGYSCPRSYPFACYKFADGSAEQANCNAQNTNNPNKAMLNEDGDLVNPLATKNPRMYYYADSILAVEWTNQHGSGDNEKSKGDIVFQMSCEGEEMMSDTCGDKNLGKLCHPRDGTPVSNNGDNLNDEATNTIPESVNEQDDYRYGRHEGLEYYRKCRNRERNKGLYIADEDLNGNSARFTRQNPNGARHGLECPEEQEYYPYWHPTPWVDLAIHTSNLNRCEAMAEQSQNVVPKYECVCVGTGCPSGEGQLPNNEFKCKDYKTNNPQVNIEWVRTPSWNEQLGNVGKPQCIKAPFSRDNHLGNVYGPGYTYSYNLTIPRYLANKKFCVLRVRYNISTTDHEGITDVGTSLDNTPDNPGQLTGADGILFDREESPTKVYETCSLEQDRFGHIGLAINSNQFGRVFQDRSYTFEVRPRPSGCNRIYNLGVRGKRGNIVQAYPSVEYDFTPNKLVVNEDDCIHVQWTGSDYNPNRNPNDAEGGPSNVNDNDQSKADRSNLVPMSLAGDNRPCCSSNCAGWQMFSLSRDQWRRLMYLDQPINDAVTYSSTTGFNGCATPEELFPHYNLNDATSRRRMEYNSTNCAKLSGAVVPYFDAGLVRPGTPGTYKYMATRNNNFSNRSQKASLTVNRAAILGTGEIVGIALGVLIGSAGVFAGVTWFKRRNAKNAGQGKSGSKAALVANASPDAVKASPVATDFQVPVAVVAQEGVVNAKFDYTSQEDGELSFKAGEDITVLKKDPSGWWEGRLSNGATGLFPSNYVDAVAKS